MKRATLRSVRSVAEMTFGSVRPRKRPEDFQELRRLAEEEIGNAATPRLVRAKDTAKFAMHLDGIDNTRESPNAGL